MITTGELEEYCKRINKEYGADTPITIQIYDQNDNLITGKYLSGISINKNGILVLKNKRSKEN